MAALNVVRSLGTTPKSYALECESARLNRVAGKVKFLFGDAVSLVARGKLRKGAIVRMNPKSARMKCGNAT